MYIVALVCVFTAFISTMMDSVEPVFFLHRDINAHDENQPTLRPYEVCVAVGKVIGNAHVDGAQNVWGVWRIYVRDRESRITLLTKKIKLRNKTVQLYDKNPRVTNVQNPNITVEKIIIKDLPLSLDNTEIDTFLKGYKQVALTTGVKYSRERNDNGELTSFRNGDRYIYAISPVFPVLPTVVQIAGHKSRVYHVSQKNVCKVCGEYGHKVKTPDCPAYSTDLNIVAFKSHEHVLSNFYPAQIQYKNETFSSLEHAYQWSKAMAFGELDIAEAIKLARHAGVAKRISKESLPQNVSKEWEESNYSIMKELLHAKAKAVPEFGNALKETAGFILAEATSDQIWGTGLPPDLTKVTKPEYWPGKNILGALLMEVKSEIHSDTPHEATLTQAPGGSTASLNTNPEIPGGTTPPFKNPRVTTGQERHDDKEQPQQQRQQLPQTCTWQVQSQRRAQSTEQENFQYSGQTNHTALQQISLQHISTSSHRQLQTGQDYQHFHQQPTPPQPTQQWKMQPNQPSQQSVRQSTRAITSGLLQTQDFVSHQNPQVAQNNRGHQDNNKGQNMVTGPMDKFTIQMEVQNTPNQSTKRKPSKSPDSDLRKDYKVSREGSSHDDNLSSIL